jgi:ribosomal protein S18 acetylase RimI-like enzyme
MEQCSRSLPAGSHVPRAGPDEHDMNLQKVQSAKQMLEVVRLAIWQEHYVPIIGQKQVDYMLEKFQSQSAVARQLDESYEYYLVINGGQSSGYVAVVPSGSERSLLISKLYVRKSERGQGLGKELLRFVEDLCRERGIEKIWLTVNKNNADSIAWYSRMGFKNAGPIVQDIGGGFVMDDFRFEKTIEQERVSADAR